MNDIQKLEIGLNFQLSILDLKLKAIESVLTPEQLVKYRTTLSDKKVDLKKSLLDESHSFEQFPSYFQELLDSIDEQFS